jgi:hypothetical protein
MAKLKVSELQVATQANPADTMYIVQNGQSKQISIATFNANITNPVFTGNIVVDGTPQVMTTAGVVSITTPTTYLNVGSGSNSITIPNGANGQVKVILTTATSGGSFTLASNIANSSSIVFSNVGHTATLMYANYKWFFIGGTARVI